MSRYEIAVGEPWDFESADGPNRLLADGLGTVSGPDEVHWSSRCLLLRVQHPFTYKDELVQYLVACPRTRDASLDSLEREGGSAGIARVRPNIQLAAGSSFEKDNVEYFMIGTIRPTS